MMYRKQIEENVFAIYNGRYFIDGDSLYINPSEADLMAHGYEPFTEEPTHTEIPPQDTPSYNSILEAIKSLVSVQISELSDSEALNVAAIFPTWYSKIGTTLSVNDRVWDDGNLYKVRMEHTVQEEWRPKDAPALYEVVTNEVASESGTIDSPYEWVDGMVAEQGKYYTFNNITYLCIRDSESPLYFEPSALVGNYFEVVE